MPVLTRGDGTPFITRAYRELLTVKTKAFLKREVVLLGDTNGGFARIFPQASGDFEAVFSHESGYLLGETVWHFFEKPEDLIYCEVLPNGEKAILVVVRQGSVFLDAEVAVTHLIDELSGLFFDDTAYDIYLYGDVPIDNDESEFSLPEESVNTLTHLDESVFLQLPPLSALALLPINQALKAVRLTSGGLSPIAAVMLIVVVAGVVWIMWTLLKPEPPPPEQQPVIHQQPKKPPGPPPDPLMAYKKALRSPEPVAILQSLVDQLHQLYGLSGWEVQSIDATLSELNLTLVPGSPSITSAPLQEWAQLNNFKVTLSDTASAKLHLPITATDRDAAEHPVMQPLLPLISQVQQRLQTVTLPDNVKLDSQVTKDNYKQVNITVSFSEVAPDYVVFLGNILVGLPVVLTGYTLSMSGVLISGSITFGVLGK